MYVHVIYILWCSGNIYKKRGNFDSKIFYEARGFLISSLCYHKSQTITTKWWKLKVHRVCHILCAVKTKLIGFQDILVFLALKWFIYWMINFRNNSHFQPNIKKIYLSFCIWDRCTYITTKVVSSNLVHG